MIIDCIADLHGYFPKLDGGDLLIIAGDLTARDTQEEYCKFYDWLDHQEYRKKIFICGNHDCYIEQEDNEYLLDLEKAGYDRGTYLCNSGTEFEGLKIWGTPHSLIFDGVNPRCTAFMGTEKDLKQKYDLIPEGIDILISHTPPFGILDRSIHGELCGSSSLREAMFRLKPRYLVCGHIHEWGGKEMDLTMTKVINCSYVNEYYKPVNKPIRLVINQSVHSRPSQ